MGVLLVHFLFLVFFFPLLIGALKHLLLWAELEWVELVCDFLFMLRVLRSDAGLGYPSQQFFE